jgi:hypothetical protein
MILKEERDTQEYINKIGEDSLSELVGNYNPTVKSMWNIKETLQKDSDVGTGIK